MERSIGFEPMRKEWHSLMLPLHQLRLLLLAAGVGFEPTIFWFQRPVQLTTLPSRIKLKPRLSVVVTRYRGPVAFTSTSEAIFGRDSQNRTELVSAPEADAITV